MPQQLIPLRQSTFWLNGARTLSDGADVASHGQQLLEVARGQAVQLLGQVGDPRQARRNVPQHLLAVTHLVGLQLFFIFGHGTRVGGGGGRHVDYFWERSP